MRSAAATLRRAVRCSESGTANPGGDRPLISMFSRAALFRLSSTWVITRLRSRRSASNSPWSMAALHKLGHVKLASFQAQKVGSRAGSSKLAVAASSGQ